MPKCTDEAVESGKVGRRVVQATFDGGDIVSDGGVLLLKQLDERIGSTRKAARAFGDERRSARVQHSVHSLLAQRIYGLCLGWSDGHGSTEGSSNECWFRGGRLGWRY